MIEAPRKVSRGIRIRRLAVGKEKARKRGPSVEPVSDERTLYAPGIPFSS
jgi:hypothetical protein